jgi:mxaA protein
MPMLCRAISLKYEMRVMRKAAIAILIFLGAPLAAQAQVQSVNLITPRLFGHFVGDVLSAEVDVRVDDGVELVPASVPQPGPLNQWLELSHSRVETASDHGAKLYRLFFDYQTFYPALDARQLDIPGITLSFKSGDHIYPAEVPGWSFGISPLREILPPAKASGGQYMQPDVLPSHYDVRREIYFALGLLAATLVALILLAYHLAWWPFRARAHRPFTEASRTIRKLLAGAETTSAYREALVVLHRAVDSTAGHAVFSEDVPSFLDEHPSFARLKEQFTRFFASSQSVFFSDKPAAGIGAFSRAELRQFSDQLAATERSAT